MADNMTPEQRRRTMRRIRSKDTAVEMHLRRALWAHGLRYRTHYRGAFGIPDVAFPGARVAVFCDSEYWHGYGWEERKNNLGTNAAFWKTKIERNIQRDAEVNSALAAEGWTVLRFWSRDIFQDVDRCVRQVARAVKSNSTR